MTIIQGPIFSIHFIIRGLNQVKSLGKIDKKEAKKVVTFPGAGVKISGKIY
jgi:hypothetical protein